jgi:hypothetical protein
VKKWNSDFSKKMRHSKSFYLWLNLFVIFTIGTIHPGGLPCWLLEGTPEAHSHAYLGNTPIVAQGCPFSSIDSSTSPMLMTMLAPAGILIAWLARSLILPNTRWASIEFAVWGSPPESPPPRLSSAF